MKKFLYTAWEVAEVFLIALIAVSAIKYFLVQPFIVNGASMEPSFYDGDYLLVDELSYRFREPARGDVIVFHAPQDYNNYYIKRIIGLPSERVDIDGNKVTIYNKQYANGEVLDESYLPNLSREWSGHSSVTLTDSQYFVLGDNRLNSLDSRYWGALEKNRIVGVVKLRLWPPSALSFFSVPTYAVHTTASTQ